MSILLATAKLPIAQAQVTSDNTVGTQVNNNGGVSEITGGETRGENLFHSFQDFSVQKNTEAFFNNSNDIGNIFSRVTGGNISNIDGVISANGSANLFLVNPAGIIFGENASLNLGGSFYGSTADSILFETGEFSATDLDNPPLLTVNAPIGFNFRDNPGDIASNGAILVVNPGETFSLLGGNLSFDGGIIGGSGSNVRLGGLTEAGTIGLSDDVSLSFPEAVARGDVSFANSAIVFVTGDEGGSIDIDAKNLSLTAESNFFAGIGVDLGFANAQAGDVAIDLTENLVVDNSNIVNANFGTGNTGDVRINARNVFFTN
ncbi:MAG: filamentous hemagglutinin N-terminal domain-containing protein, partial [Cyanobacteria bacterium J06631_2]